MAPTLEIPGNKSGDSNVIGLSTTKVSGVNRLRWFVYSVMTVALCCADMFVRSRLDAGTDTVPKLCELLVSILRQQLVLYVDEPSLVSIESSARLLS